MDDDFDQWGADNPEEYEDYVLYGETSGDGDEASHDEDFEGHDEDFEVHLPADLLRGRAFESIIAEVLGEAQWVTAPLKQLYGPGLHEIRQVSVEDASDVFEAARQSAQALVLVPPLSANSEWSQPGSWQSQLLDAVPLDIDVGLIVPTRIAGTLATEFRHKALTRRDLHASVTFSGFPVFTPTQKIALDEGVSVSDNGPYGFRMGDEFALLVFKVTPAARVRFVRGTAATFVEIYSSLKGLRGQSQTAIGFAHNGSIADSDGYLPDQVLPRVPTEAPVEKAPAKPKAVISSSDSAAPPKRTTEGPVPTPAPGVAKFLETSPYISALLVRQLEYSSPPPRSLSDTVPKADPPSVHDESFLQNISSQLEAKLADISRLLISPSAEPTSAAERQLEKSAYEAALKRIQERSYGVCAASGRKISQAQLRADPLMVTEPGYSLLRTFFEFLNFDRGLGVKPGEINERANAAAQVKPAQASSVSGTPQEGDLLLVRLSGREREMRVHKVTGKHISNEIPRKGVILRPKRALQIGEERFLASFLESELFLKLLRQVSPRRTGNVKPSELSEIFVRVPDGSALDLVQDLLDAEKQFRRYADDSLRETNNFHALLNSQESLSSTTRTFAKNSRSIRQRHRSAKSVSNLDERIRSNYPLPLAFRWRLLEARRDESSRLSQDQIKLELEDIHEACEVLLGYLACVGVALAQHEGKALGVLGNARENLSYTFGLWKQICLNFGEADFGSIDSELAKGLNRYFSDERVKKAIEALNVVRNADAHGRLSPYHSLLVESREQIRMLFEEVEFISDYPLVLVEQVSWDAISRRASLKFRLLRGDHPEVPLEPPLEQTTNDFEVGALYIRSGPQQSSALILARPLLLSERCPQCGLRSTYLPDRLVDRKVRYKCLENGHTSPKDLKAQEDALKKFGFIK
jgi:RNA polymerase-binding transcription factor DksA